MDKKKSVILFSSILGVLFLIGVVFVFGSADPFGALSLTTVGEAFNLVNWTQGNETINSGGHTQNDTFNITIQFNNTLLTNITDIWITIHGDTGHFDFTNLTNSSILMGLGGGLSATEGANYSCHPDYWNSSTLLTQYWCSNTTAYVEFIAGSTLYFQSVIIPNGTQVNNTGGNSTGLMINITTLDADKQYNQSILFHGVDYEAPAVLDINISDGNRTLYNGTGEGGLNMSYFTAIKGAHNNLSKTNLVVNVLIAEPNMKNVSLYYNTTDVYMGAGGGNDTFNNGTRIAMTESVRTVGSSRTHSIYTATIPGGALVAGNLTSFTILATDQYNQVRNATDLVGGLGNGYGGVGVPFVVKIADAGATASIARVNATDSRPVTPNSLQDGSELDGSSDYLRADNVTFNVRLKNELGKTTLVKMYYNSSDAQGVFSVDNNGSIIGNERTLDLVNWSATTYMNSIDLAGNDTNIFSFAYEIRDKTGYRFIVGPYKFIVDGTNPTEPTLTVPSNRVVDVSSSTGITYSCSSTDVTSGGVTYAWTLTKPGGATVSKTGSSATFSSNDINLAGTYNIMCTATDAVGHSSDHTSTSTETFAVTYSSGTGTPSGGSSSSSGPSASPSFDVDFSQVTEGTFSVAQGSTRTFSFDGATTHTLRVDSVVGNSVAMTLTSTAKQITLNVGESTEVDINEDGASDVKVTLNSLSNSVADISIKKIEEGAVVIAEEEQRALEEEVTEGPAEEITPPKKKANLTLWITIIVIVIVLIVGYFLIKKK